jgi:hypothetical protein
MVPIPASEKDVVSGRKIDKIELEFVQRGVTKRADVIEMLGKPYAVFEDLNIIAYQWETIAGHVLWTVISPAGGPSGMFDFAKHYFLFVAFDHDDIVTKFEFVRRKGFDTIPIAKALLNGQMKRSDPPDCLRNLPLLQYRKANQFFTFIGMVVLQMPRTSYLL